MDDPYKETFETWNKVANLYQDKFMDLDLYNDTYNLFCTLLPQISPAILEIGCGPGNITRYLLARRSDFQIMAIDVAPSMVELAKLNAPGADCRVMDCRDIDQLEAGFDAIMCGFCIPYLSGTDFSRLIGQCSRLLNANGILYLSFVAGDIGKSGYQAGSSGDKVYFYYHDLDGVKNALQQHYFEILEIILKEYAKADGTSETHTIILAKK